jgi:periplasmic divalent cation tolerance protein
MLMVAWTTVATRDDAARLAEDAVRRGLAACVQVDGPIRSFYRWDGKVEDAEEFRLTFKFIPARRRDLAQWLHTAHPYATPQWVVVRAEEVSEKYLSWARANSTSAPL